MRENSSLLFASAVEMARLVRRGVLSSVELLEAQLAQIDRDNPALNALVTIDREGALRRAREADEALARGELWGALHGVPFTLKDSHESAGMRTTAGYPPLANHLPVRDGTVAARLRGAGGILLGKSNVSELLHDYQSVNPLFGRTNNPWAPSRTAGGSSGGAAAALAAGLTPLDVGSDIGGSIRIPAHFCGLYALKPTEHRISEAGHIPPLPGQFRSARVMTVTGPMARSVEDLALAFRLLAGPDGRDSEVPPVPVREVAAPPLKGLRVAWAATLPGLPVAADIRQALTHLATELEQQGVQIEEQAPPIDLERQLEERARLRAMMESVEPGHEPPPQPVSLADYLAALERRDFFIRSWEDFFAGWDLFLCPVAMCTAFPHCPMGMPLPVDGEPIEYWWLGRHCNLFGYTGHPVVVLPISLDREGLPIGVQLVARRWQDERLLAISSRLAGITGWRPLSASR